MKFDSLKGASREDLAYAIQTLVEQGTVSDAQVKNLLSLRQKRVDELIAELSFLRGNDKLRGEYKPAVVAPAPAVKADSKVRGKFYALIGHHVTGPAKDYWQRTASRIGFDNALAALEKNLAKKQIDDAPVGVVKPVHKVPEWRHFAGLYSGHIRTLRNPATKKHIQKIRRERGLKAAVSALLKLNK